MEKVRDHFVFFGWSDIKNGSQKLLRFMWMGVPFASYLTCEILHSLAHSLHDQSQVRVLSASCAGFI